MHSNQSINRLWYVVSKFRSAQTKVYKIGICCFFAKHAVLGRKRKDWLAKHAVLEVQ
jgi:hypothetical protein